jgi:hypothetical protein
VAVPAVEPVGAAVAGSCSPRSEPADHRSGSTVVGAGAVNGIESRTAVSVQPVGHSSGNTSGPSERAGFSAFFRVDPVGAGRHAG